MQGARLRSDSGVYGTTRAATARLVRRAAPVVALIPVQLAILLGMSVLAPRFFWFDDSEIQFGPAWWWLGHTMRDGRVQTMNPDLGSGGAFTLDVQYGALDPLHWVMHAIVGSMSDLLQMSWFVAAVCTILVGTAVTALCRHYGAASWLALAAGLGASNGGFLIWFGSSWWPMLWSVGWVAWLWYGLATRAASGAVIAGVATAGLLGSGNPYVWPFALVIVAGQLIERRRVAGAWSKVFGSSEVIGRILASAGGLVVSLPTLLTLVGSSGYASRPAPEGILANNGFAVPNLLDVALGGPTLTGALNAWGGALAPAPALSTALFAVPLLALVDWRKALRSPGVLTALALVVIALLATQIPATVAGLRVPMRYVVIAQTALPVLAVAASVAAPRLTRPRLVGAALLVAAQVALSLSRSPALWVWHLAGGILVALAVAAVIVVLARRSRGGGWAVVAGVLLVAVSCSTWFVGERAMSQVESRADQVGQGSSQITDAPYRMLRSAAPAAGTTVQAYRERSLATDAAVTVLQWTDDPDRGWSRGVMEGNANLFADLQPGFGSIAVGHRAYGVHVCRTYLGTLCGSPDDPASATALLEVEPTTGETWLDLTSSDEVLLADASPASIRAHLDETRVASGAEPGYTRYVRSDSLPGRVTWAEGATLGDDAETSAAYPGEDMDVYRVSTGADPGAVVLRTLFWPGIVAQVDGRDVAVTALDGALVRIDLPAGLDDARLSVAYSPPGVALLMPLISGGALLIILGGVIVVLGRYSRLRAYLAERGRGAGEPSSLVAAAMQFLRFFWSSGLGLALDFALFGALTAAGVAVIVANTLSSAAAVVLLYFLATRYAFRKEGRVSTFVLFVGWYILSIVVFSAVIQAGVTVLGLAPVLSKLLSVPLSFSANFLFSRFLFSRSSDRAGAVAAQTTDDEETT